MSTDVDDILNKANQWAKNFNQFDPTTLLKNFNARQELSKKEKTMYICETQGCLNPAHIRVIAYEGATGQGKDMNDIYFCINHFNYFRNMMKVDVSKLKKRRDFESKQGIRK